MISLDDKLEERFRDLVQRRFYGRIGGLSIGAAEAFIEYLKKYDSEQERSNYSTKRKK